MSEEGVRPRRRDWLYIGVLALVLTVGLVHYARLSADERPPTATGTAATPAPSSEQARLESSPTSAPADPTGAPAPTPAPAVPGATVPDSTAPPSTAGTCWDGRPTTAIAQCGLPEGTRGLQWVFPSFDPERATCRRARPADGTPAYAVVTSYVCFERALGQPVTVTYDQVRDPREVEAWMDRQVGPDNVVDLPGTHGGRCLMEDVDQRPARISAAYEKFPYVVSVFAPTKNAARRAWKSLVTQRPTSAIRGIRS